MVLFTSLTWFIFALAGIVTAAFYFLWKHLRWFGIIPYTLMMMLAIKVGELDEFVVVTFLAFCCFIPYFIVKLIQKLVMKIESCKS